MFAQPSKSSPREDSNQGVNAGVLDVGRGRKQSAFRRIDLTHQGRFDSTQMRRSETLKSVIGMMTAMAW
jgi:hypothetical protein